MEGTMKIHKQLMLFSFILLTPNVHAVVVNGMDWRQVTETTSISYIQLDQIYDTSNGQIDTGPGGVTEIDGIDFAGWTWASVSDVANMFSTLPGLSIGFDERIEVINSKWAPIFTPDLFAPNLSSFAVNLVRGITRDLARPTDSYSPLIQNTLDINQSDIASTDALSYIGNVHATYGVWLYQETSPIPIPGAIWLFGTGLVGFIEVSRRKSRKHKL